MYNEECHASDSFKKDAKGFVSYTVKVMIIVNFYVIPLHTTLVKFVSSAGVDITRIESKYSK